MLVRYSRQAFDIRDISRRIANAFAIDRPGVFVDQFFNGIGMIVFAKRPVDSLLWKDVRKQSVGGAVELRERKQCCCPISAILMSE